MLGRGSTSAAADVSRGAFTSVQVNVDAFGNNIVGDAANEPTIAVNPANPNQIVIAWRQFDTILSDFRQAGIGYSHDRGQTWTKFTLDPGHFRSDPVLGADAAGRFFLSSFDGNTVDVWRSLDGGVNWAKANAFGGDKEWMAVDDRTAGMGAGHIYQNWNVQVTCCPPKDFTRSINNGVSFQLPIAIRLPSMKWGTLDTGPDGTLYLAGSTLDGWGHLFTKSSNAKDPAVTPTFDTVRSVNLGGHVAGFGINPSGLLGQTWIAVDNSTGATAGNVYIASTVADVQDTNPTNVRFIRSVDDGQTWSQPVLVNDDPASGAWHWFGTMSVAPNGRIDVIWNDTRNDPGNFLTEVYYSFSIDGGLTWASNVPLTPAWNPGVGYPNQRKIGDYYHMVSDDLGADLAYAATFNGEQDVYYLRIPHGCNSIWIEGDCDDGVSCTLDRCEQMTGQCSHAPQDALCNDALFCNGEEHCDAATGCQPGLRPNCDDNVACTTDACSDAEKSCTHTPNDAQCDNGLFCDGEEFCDPALGCRLSPPPCSEDQRCDEDAHICEPGRIPTVSTWGLVILTLLILVGAKVRFPLRTPST